MRAFWRRDPPAGLGPGVWRRCHDRFGRAVDRYHQMMDRCPPGPARDALEAEGTRLAAALDDVLAVCRLAQQRWPSGGLDIPPGGDGCHRALSRAAAGVAQAAEAAAMTATAARAAEASTALVRAAAAARTVDIIVATATTARRTTET